MKMLYVLPLVLLGACGYPTTNSPYVPGSPVSYAMVRDQVFSRCVSCHGTSGGVTLETYAQVKSQISQVDQAVFVTKTMPKGGSLNQDQLMLLRVWIDAGAPETVPTQTPAPRSGYY